MINVSHQLHFVKSSFYQTKTAYFLDKSPEKGYIFKT